MPVCLRRVFWLRVLLCLGLAAGLGLRVFVVSGFGAAFVFCSVVSRKAD